MVRGSNPTRKPLPATSSASRIAPALFRHPSEPGHKALPAREQADDEMMRFRALSGTAGALVICLGVLTLSGWIFDVEILKTVFPGLVSMKANSAICFILAGCALLVQVREPVTGLRLHLAQVIAGVVIAVALLTLAEYGLGRGLGLDQMLFRETQAEARPSFPGRMSLASALSFLLTATALWTLEQKSLKRWRWPTQYLTLGAATLTLFAFIGHFYGVENLDPVAPYSAIALHSVLAFWCLCLGILFARPNHGLMAVFTSDTPGGVLARRMLPAAILAPVLTGWLRVLGQRAGMYGLGFGSALVATALILVFTALIAWAGRALNRTEAERQRNTEALRQSREELRALAGRLQTVREQERSHVAREIHDVLAQELTRLKLDIAWVRRRLSQSTAASQQEMLEDRLATMSSTTDTAINAVQRIATELRPAVLDSLGLCAAIEWQAKEFESRTGIDCATTLPEVDPGLDPDRSTALFRILQESLTNVARHADATKVEIALARQDAQITLSVQDNGRAIPAAKLEDPHSAGLLGMRERASLLGGECHISGSPGRGTRVEARLPRAPEPASTKTTL